MLTVERQDELNSLFWSETNDEWTQDWRDGLMPEEIAYVNALDTGYEHALTRVAQQILDVQAAKRQRDNK